jgi:hypothetical protein
MEVVRGQDAMLNCETYDSTYFQWFKDGTTLMTTSNKFRTVGDDKHSTLVIKQFNEYDEGKHKNLVFFFLLLPIFFRCLYLCNTRRSIKFYNTSNSTRTNTT